MSKKNCRIQTVIALKLYNVHKCTLICREVWQRGRPGSEERRRVCAGNRNQHDRGAPAESKKVGEAARKHVIYIKLN
jgi:hypothetical protein